MSHPVLDQRSETLLRLLISRFIVQGQPIGSRTLAHEPGLSISAATVRNVMADLQDLGLIQSPHISAGRIPTVLGYRLFIDSMLKLEPLPNEEKEEIEIRLNEENDAKELMNEASKLLSEVTKFCGVVFLPDSSIAKLRQIEFVRLSKHRVLVILITEDGQVQNRVISVDREYSPSELVSAANYFNETFRGKSLSSVRELLLLEMKRDSQQINELLQTAVNIAANLFVDDHSDDDVVVSGRSNLFDVPDLAAIDKIKKIFEIFKARHSLLTLLNKSVKARGVSIFIGAESGYENLDDCSVITAPYQIGGHNIGAIGVIGPTRMAYEHVIPVVDVTAQMLGNALSHLNQKR